MIRDMSMIDWENKFWIMLGKDIIVVYSLMVRQVVENPTQW
jgi:hypothetical protein